MQELHAAVANYIYDILQPAGFQTTDAPVWVLGKEYNLVNDLERAEFNDDLRSRLWFTYRNSFPPIRESSVRGLWNMFCSFFFNAETRYTSDTGWGCVHRCGQMLLGEAFIRQHLGRNWLWKPGTVNATYLEILNKFNDLEECPYSIQKIAITGRNLNKEVGDWFGPSTVAQVLKRLSIDVETDLVIHVAMNQVVRNQIKKMCKGAEVGCECRANKENAVKECEHCASVHEEKLKSDSYEEGECDNFAAQCQRVIPKSHWKPLVLVIPIALGLSHVTAPRIEALKWFFTLKESLGFIGGRNKFASYFIGYTGTKLIFLDPHTTQLHSSVMESVDETYHCSQARQMPFVDLDPSISLCMYCDTEETFDNWCKNVSEKLVGDNRLFEILDDDLSLGFSSEDRNMDAIFENERVFTSDDECEILM